MTGWRRRRRGATRTASTSPGTGSHPEVTLALSCDEALVLFDWLARTLDAGQPAPFVDPAERRALCSVEALLERTLTTPLRPDYLALLTDARRRLGHRDDTPAG